MQRLNTVDPIVDESADVLACQELIDLIRPQLVIRKQWQDGGEYLELKTYAVQATLNILSRDHFVPMKAFGSKDGIDFMLRLDKCNWMTPTCVTATYEVEAA